MAYNRVYNKRYESGFHDDSATTEVDALAMNNIESAFKNVEDYLEQGAPNEYAPASVSEYLTDNKKTGINDAISKKHSHDNKAVLDKFGEKDGNPTYDGKDIGGGGSGGAVDSVNGQIGDVVLSASDVNALPDNTPLAPSDAEKNVIEGIKVNGQPVEPDADRVVNIEAGGGGTQEVYVGSDISKAPDTCVLFIDTSRNYPSQSSGGMSYKQYNSVLFNKFEKVED